VRLGIGIISIGITAVRGTHGAITRRSYPECNDSRHDQLTIDFAMLLIYQLSINMIFLPRSVAMIEIETQGRLGVVTLSRPQRRNALGEELVRQLAAAFAAMDRDDAIGAILLQAAPPCFCAGSDLKELAGLSVPEMCAHEARTAAFARGITLMSKPVVAAVEGAVIGGGVTLAAACDVVVTAANARWHLTEVALGWLPPWGLQPLLARVGPVRARLLTWGAEPTSGTEAHRLGLADELTEPGEAAPRARQLASGLAELPRLAVASTKLFYQAPIAAQAEALDAWANRLFEADAASEAARATFEKFGVKS
jgi:enoyl-CoA hydratase/carnithine racemase